MTLDAIGLYFQRDQTWWKAGKGMVVKWPFYANSFEILGLERDLIVRESNGIHAEGIAWTHRTAPGFDIYCFTEACQK